MTEARILKGFRDSLPLDEIKRSKMIDTVETVFASYGYSPIDTPCLEYEDILLSKSAGETEKQIYAFEDNGGRRVALRFDLTVPFARFVALHSHKEIELPFKRYHIAKVWRGENSQAGRFREFYQCDIDTVGVNNALSDAEIVEVIANALMALSESDFKIHISHRGLLKTLLENCGLENKNTDVLRILDKLSKIGESGVKSELSNLGLDNAKIDILLKFISEKKDASVLLDANEYNAIATKLGGKTESLDRLKAIYEVLPSVVKKHIVVDFSITRGLDYYTGFVFETFLSGSENIGSVSSGGRYDNLTGLFSKEVVSGVGGSIGLDRLITALGNKTKETVSTADLYVLYDDDLYRTEKDHINELRALGFRVDDCLLSRKMNQIYKYIEMNNIPYMLSVKKDSYILKTIATRNEEKYSSFEEVKKSLLQKKGE